MKILLATDGSDFSKAAIDILPDIIGKPEDAIIKILSVYEHPSPMGTEPFAISSEFYNELEQIRQKAAENIVEQAKTQIKQMFPNAAVELTTRVAIGSPQQIIVETADEWKANLIIIGSHGYSFWSRILLGSVSNSVVQHAHCSVLVVRDINEEE
jgi:nucleotide-binding universal stress UspA family protein